MPSPFVLSYNCSFCWSLRIVVGPYTPSLSHKGLAQVCNGTARRTLQRPPPYDLPHCAAHHTAQTATLGSLVMSPSHEGTAQVCKGTARATRAQARAK